MHIVLVDRIISGQCITTDTNRSVSGLLVASWNVMAHAQKPDFVFPRKERVYLNRRWRQFNRLLAAELCASAVVLLDTPCSEVGWRVLATHSIQQFPLHFPFRVSPCAITFQLESTAYDLRRSKNITKRLSKGVFSGRKTEGYRRF